MNSLELSIQRYAIFTNKIRINNKNPNKEQSVQSESSGKGHATTAIEVQIIVQAPASTHEVKFATGMTRPEVTPFRNVGAMF
jgi:hypothetical protein